MDTFLQTPHQPSTAQHNKTRRHAPIHHTTTPSSHLRVRHAVLFARDRDADRLPLQHRRVDGNRRHDVAVRGGRGGGGAARCCVCCLCLCTGGCGGGGAARGGGGGGAECACFHANTAACNISPLSLAKHWPAPHTHSAQQHSSTNAHPYSGAMATAAARVATVGARRGRRGSTSERGARGALVVVVVLLTKARFIVSAILLVCRERPRLAVGCVWSSCHVAPKRKLVVWCARSE